MASPLWDHPTSSYKNETLWDLRIHLEAQEADSSFLSPDSSEAHSQTQAMVILIPSLPAIRGASVLDVSSLAHAASPFLEEARKHPTHVE